MTAISALLLSVASFAATHPADKRDIAIRSSEGRSIAVRQWIVQGNLGDGRPVVVTFDFFDSAKSIDVGLIVAGKSWGKQRIDEKRFPKINLQSLGLGEFLGHVQVSFEYGANERCSSPGNLQPELTVDFTSKSVELQDSPGACPRPSRE